MHMNELLRRKELLKKIQSQKNGLIKPSFLKENNIYRGAQGIYIDQTLTKNIDPKGITVSILHTGRHYPDELSEDGLIYHYPQTNRGTRRDTTEIEATKNCKKLNLPLFIILPGERINSRTVKEGWVINYNDTNKTFFISFSNQKVFYEDIKAEQEFYLTSKEKEKFTKIKQRPNQQKFRFDLLKNYGSRCALCSINNEKLLAAAHIRSKDDQGSDDWRNGIILCANHHLAFDNNLIKINPKNLKVETKEKNLKIESNFINTLTGKKPHIKALEWKYKKLVK